MELADLAAQESKMVGAFLFCVYAFLQGIADAVLWSRKGHEAFEGNEHVVLFVGRLVVLMLAVVGMDVVTAFLVGCMFPFIHSGAYYSSRNDIDHRVYPDGWKSEPSEDSSAEINFTFKQRLWLFIAAISCLIVWIVIKPSI